MSSEWDLFSMHGRLQPGNAWPVAVIRLLAAQERRPEPTQVVKPLGLFVTGIEQPLAESPTREGKRTASSRPYGTPQVDLRHVRGRCMYHRIRWRCLFLVAVTENWVTQQDDKNVYTIYFNKGGTWWQGLAQLSRELAPQKKDWKELIPAC